MNKQFFVLLIIAAMQLVAFAGATLTSDEGAFTLKDNGNYEFKFTGHAKMVAKDKATESTATADEMVAELNDKAELADVVLSGNVSMTKYYNIDKVRYKVEIRGDKYEDPGKITNKGSEQVWIRLTALDGSDNTVILKAKEINYDGNNKLIASGSPQITSKIKADSGVTTINAVSRSMTVIIGNNYNVELNDNARITSTSSATNQSTDIRAQKIVLYPYAESIAKTSGKNVTYASASGNVVFDIKVDVKDPVESFPEKQRWQGKCEKLSYILESTENGPRPALELFKISPLTITDRSDNSISAELANAKTAYTTLDGKKFEIITTDD